MNTKWKWNKNKRFLRDRWITCRCGCGEWIRQLDTRNQLVFYKHGHNNPENNFKPGKDHPSYKNGKHIHKVHKYVLILVYNDYRNKYSGNYNQRYIPEHRLVWEEHYNVCLLSWAEVHHKNEIRNDNRIENLQAMIKGEHRSLHNDRRKIIMMA